MDQEQVSALECINEKLDQILTYQKNAHRWAVAKGVLNFLLFFVLVILPIIWAYSIIRTFAGQLDIGKLASQYNQATQLLNQADELKGQLKDQGVQEILKNLPK
jgi:hypothetical protein